MAAAAADAACQLALRPSRPSGSLPVASPPPPPACLAPPQRLLVAQTQRGAGGWVDEPNLDPEAFLPGGS